MIYLATSCKGTYTDVDLWCGVNIWGQHMYFVSLFLPLSLSHTHTHTHTNIERETERERDKYAGFINTPRKLSKQKV